MKLPYFNLYPLDWLRDTRQLSPQAKGIWMDILCYAWNEPSRGVYERDEMAMCYEHGLDYDSLKDVLAELANVAEVTFANEKVTVISRRMVKIQKSYENNANRQARFKAKRLSNEKVTDKTLDVRRHQRLTSSPLPSKGGALARNAPLVGASATREKTTPMATAPIALIENDEVQQLEHEDFLRIGWRQSDMPANEFGWDALVRSLDVEERVQSKWREKFFKEREAAQRVPDDTF